MALADLDLKMRFRSGEDDLVSDFYLPCFSAATRYDRAVGYFTSGALAVAAPALPTFLAGAGKMRLVVSPRLTNADVEAMLEGYNEREAIISESLSRELTADGLPDPLRDALSCLSWLIANERLEIQVAFLPGARAAGIYHEKIGVFADEAGTRIAFQGSANESVGGLVNNFESILVFSTSKPAERPIAEQLEADFDRLWKGRASGVELLALPEAARQTLLETYQPSRAEEIVEAVTERPLPPRGTPSLPSSLEIRPYQRDAMAAWFGAGGRGVLAMATGSGKTITALAIATRLQKALGESGLATVVVCPYQHLVKQWEREARSFGFRPILCYRSRQLWEEELQSQAVEMQAKARPALMAITTNATFATSAFQSALEGLPSRSFLIADEMHNLGAPALRSALPERFRYRLGLSATPERHRDTEGSAALQRYFGETVFELSLEEAIEMGALTPYRYFPQVIVLDDDELEGYLALSEQIGRRMAISGDDPEGDELLLALLVKRARLIASARGKIPRLVELFAGKVESTHNLVYCGDGRVETADREEDERQVEAVVRALGSDLGMSVNRYTSDVDVEDRDGLRERFARGELNALVAIRCLDEGVDIPETRRAYILASSTNPRQFIQRRGRVLRRSPGKDFAEIYDFIVVPPPGADEQIDPAERRLMARELERVMEFAAIALNGPEALGTLRELRSRYNLLHIGT